MEDYPTTLMAFEKQFLTENACLNYLYKLRWPKGYLCPHCGNNKGWRIRDDLIQCANCFYQASITSGTIFHRTRKPLTIWFRAIWWVTSQKHGANALGLQRILGLGSYKTAWAWLHKLRRAMVRPNRDCLVGTIEIDETYIGGEKHGKRGRGALGKALVLIATEIEETHIGRIRLQLIKNASATSLETAIQSMVEKGSEIQTDGWAGYNQLNLLGYKHEVVRKASEIGQNLLPHCNRVASLLKRWLLGTHQGAVAHEHLNYYLDEYTFRFNRRTSQYRGKLFYRLLQNAVALEPITFKQITKGIRGPKPEAIVNKLNLT